MLDKMGFLYYCGLPGIVAERLHFIFSSHYELVAAKQRKSVKVEGDESENDLHDAVSEESFLRNLDEIFCGPVTSKMRFVFKL